MLMRSAQDKYVMSKSKKKNRVLIGESIYKFQNLQDSKFNLV